MRWTLWVDFAAAVGLGLTTWAWGELGTRWGLGASLAALWGGGWLLGGALWVAKSCSRRRSPDVRTMKDH